MKIEEILNLGPIIPVLTIENLEDAIPLSEALIKGGLTVLEITLRTQIALAAVERISRSFPAACVGVGTLLDSKDFLRAKDVGASFAVSPGISLDLVEQAAFDGLPYLPGIQTSSEAMMAYRTGLRSLKFFPAKAAGGIYGLKQLAPLYPGLMFCPTGGIGFSEVPNYLKEKNVACVGGSFASPPELIKAQDWSGITAVAKKAMKL